MFSQAALALFLLLAFLPLSDARPAFGATFTVTKTADTADGVCDSDCSLREAIIAGNAAPGADTIVVASGTYTLTIAGRNENSSATGDLDITDNVIIDATPGASTVIEACDSSGGLCSGLDRVMHIDPFDASVAAMVKNMTVRNGDTFVPAGVGEPGGGVLNNGELTLEGVTVEGNFALAGGGIWNSGTLTVSDSTISSNTAGGNFSSAGGGVYSTGALTLDATIVQGNSATFWGGGILSTGTLSLTRSVVSDNVTTTTGTGTFAGGISAGGVATIDDTTISGNTADIGGGVYSTSSLTITGVSIAGNTGAGLWNGAFSGGKIHGGTATAQLTNATVSGNSVGIHNESSGDLTLNYVTVAGNTLGGISNINGGYALVRNGILANNASGSNCSGGVTSGGNNLEDANTCAFAGAGDLANTNPLLAPLASNGGPTETHALLDGSPAIDSGDSANCPPIDQRGAYRPIGPACDMGAYEFGDADADTWSDTAENMIGTDPLAACGIDAWPADINNSGISDISDIVSLTGVFGQAVPPAPVRYDIAPDPPAAPGSRFVDITDIIRMAGSFGQSCGGP